MRSRSPYNRIPRTPPSRHLHASPTGLPLNPQNSGMTLSLPSAALKACGLVSLAVLSTASEALAQGTFLQQSNGVVAIQMESADPAGAWSLSTSTPGFTGQGYFRWDGPNFFSIPGNGIFGFDFEITTSGEHRVAIYNRHEDPDPTEENDTWVRMDGGAWVKAFSNNTVGAWTWETRNGSVSGPVRYNLTPGSHRLEFSGRSNGFKMDRVHIFPNGVSGENASLPESPRRFGDTYCNSVANSTGAVSSLEAIGSPVASQNDVTLHGSSLPVGALGYMAVARTQSFFANPGGSTGNVCLGANIGRYIGSVLTADGSGQISMALDLTAIPQPTGSQATLAGETWNFQFWHRDTAPGGGATSNFSRGLEVNFQ